MYQIALCDDETAALDRSESMLAAYRTKHPEYEFFIKRFAAAKDLLHRAMEWGYAPDLLFLDIYMPDLTGLSAAKKLRAMGNDCRIIFLTTSMEHALDAFGVNAAQYLVKPITEKELFPVLDRLFHGMEQERKKYILLRIDGRVRRVALGDIISCEAQGKRQCLYRKDGTPVILRTTITELFQVLSQYREFVKVGASYIVNLAHIESLNSHEVYLDDGRNIYLPRGAYQPLREQYFRYYCEEG